MSLIQCSECNKDMSDAAPSCPHCGKPNQHVSQLSPSARKVGILLAMGIFIFPPLFSWFTLRKGYSTKARVITFGWLALCLVIAFTGESAKSPSSRAPSVSSAQPSQTAQDKAAEQQKALDALPVVTSRELAVAYDENTVAADQRFKSKQFKVKGVVTGINTDIMGNPYITMKGTNQFLEPQFQFDKKASEQLAQLKKGMNVVLICTGKGDIAKTPMSDDCFMQ